MITAYEIGNNIADMKSKIIFERMSKTFEIYRIPMKAPMASATINIVIVLCL